MLKAPDRQAFIVQGTECEINSNALCAYCYSLGWLSMTLSSACEGTEYFSEASPCALTANGAKATPVTSCLQARGLFMQPGGLPAVQDAPTSRASPSAGDRRDSTTTQQNKVYSQFPRNSM